MERKRCGVWLGAALAVVLVTQEARAQGGGGMPNIPSREEIAAKVRQVLAASPEETIELEGVCKITYKKVPTDPQRVAQLLGQQMGGQIPPGTDIDQYIRMYQPQITELLNEFLADFGKIEVLVELKVKSKRIPVGEHKLGLVCDGERPVALVISSEALRRPVDIRLKTRPVDLQPELKLEIKKKDEETKFDLRLDFMRFQAQSKSKVEPTEGGGGGADADEKDDDDKDD